MACPAIAMSLGPIDMQAGRSTTLTSVLAPTVARSQTRTASRRVQNLSISCTWMILRSGRAEAHIRDQDMVVTKGASAQLPAAHA